jgi:hypothetical protein
VIKPGKSVMPPISMTLSEGAAGCDPTSVIRPASIVTLRFPGNMALPSKILALVKVSMAISPPNLIRRTGSLRPRLDNLPQNTHKNATGRAAAGWRGVQIDGARCRADGAIGLIA